MVKKKQRACGICINRKSNVILLFTLISIILGQMVGTSHVISLDVGEYSTEENFPLDRPDYKSETTNEIHSIPRNQQNGTEIPELSQIGEIIDSEDVEFFAVHENYLYVAVGYKGLQIYDVRNRTKVFNITNGNFCLFVLYENNSLFVTFSNTTYS